MKRIAENIVKDPKNNDYKQIKRHGKTFMRNVVEPKGALDFLVEASIARPFLPSISIFSVSTRTDALSSLSSLDSARRCCPVHERLLLLLNLLYCIAHRPSTTTRCSCFIRSTSPI